MTLLNVIVVSLEEVLILGFISMSLSSKFSEKVNSILESLILLVIWIVLKTFNHVNRPTPLHPKFCLAVVHNSPKELCFSY